MSMIVGLNFLDFARREPEASRAAPATLAGVGMRLSPKAILRRPWRATRQELQLLWYNYGDPLIYLARRQGLFDDSEIAVAVDRMRSYEPEAGSVEDAGFPAAAE
jgi:hypothetical protein